MSTSRPRSSWVLIAALVFSILLAVAFFFYGLVRQIQAEQNQMAAVQNMALATKSQQAAEEMARTMTVRIEALEKELAACSSQSSTAAKAK